MEEKIKELLSNVISEKGYILDEVIYEKENGTNFLRLIIDKEGYINVNDCVLISELVNPILDDVDLIKESYILDVCSFKKGSE